MRFYKLIPVLALQMLLWFSCSEQSQGASDKYTIKGEIKNADRDSIGLYEYQGGEPMLVKQVKLEKSGEAASFNLEAEVQSPGIYLLAIQMPDAPPAQPNMPPQGKKLNGFQLVLGKDKKLQVSADAKDMEKTYIVSGSDENTRFKEFNLKTNDYQTQIRNLQMEAQQAAQSPAGATGNPQMATLQKKTDSLYNVQADYHTSMSKGNDIVAKIAQIYYYAPYGYGDSKEKFKSEEEYFPNSFFSKVNFKDPINGYVPIYYYKVSNFASILLMQYGYDFDRFTQKMDAYINQTPEKSKARKSTILAVLGAAEQMQRYNQGLTIDLFVYYCKKYLADFPNDPKAENFKQIVNTYGKAMAGEPAPDIELENPEGKKMKLSSLKGKVVLIDFWASWCGPCRRENPNVVRVYNEYKDKGFDIFSVSLDNNKEKWIEAIKADNLTWSSHVSDLQGWQSPAAALYGVKAIPKTFLIGKDGKIIAKDLRGEQLEKKLAEVLKK